MKALAAQALALITCGDNVIQEVLLCSYPLFEHYATRRYICNWTCSWYISTITSSYALFVIAEDITP